MREQIYNYMKDGEDVYRARADRDIEINRKGDFELILTDKNGNSLNDGQIINAELTDLDFNFGANIFMLGEYDEPERNSAYEKEFCGLFNTATIPLYWEGTEPKKGYLRYDKSTPRDVYRRPPADTVVEFCRKNNLRMKGHPLFWTEFVPDWLPNDYRELKKYIVKRFEEISQRYSKSVECFDVVNEPSRLYDVYMRDRKTRLNGAMLVEDDYCVWLFKLARQLFPANKLIINDTVWASFHEFRGKYSGYYLNLKDLINRGVEIDEIGLQCHLGTNEPENAYNAERLYDVLDTYASLGKTINISEISIPSVFEDGEDEDLQAQAAEQLYKICFSHPAVTGLTWWNLPDDGVLTIKRAAGDENIPSIGLIDPDYSEKKAYKTLQKLIKQDWTTNETIAVKNGTAKFGGFYGKYKITANVNGKNVSAVVDFTKCASDKRRIQLEI